MMLTTLCDYAAREIAQLRARLRPIRFRYFESTRLRTTAIRHSPTHGAGAPCAVRRGLVVALTLLASTVDA